MSLYVHRRRRRRLLRAGYVILALLLLAPKIDLADAPQLTAFLDAVGLRQT